MALSDDLLLQPRTSRRLREGMRPFMVSPYNVQRLLPMARYFYLFLRGCVRSRIQGYLDEIAEFVQEID